MSEFEVLGIAPGLGLGPEDTTAFITAPTFEGAGSFTSTMTPITTNGSAPEPASLTLLVPGLLRLEMIGVSASQVEALRQWVGLGKHIAIAAVGPSLRPDLHPMRRRARSRGQ